MRNFLVRFRDSFMRFMQGRYGTDQLNKVLFVGAIVCEVFFMFTRWSVLSILSMVLILLNVLRMFSRNVSKRYAENQKFLKLVNRLKTLKTHHIYKCPSCRQNIRVPRLHGKRVEIRCPKCGNTFIKKV